MKLFENRFEAWNNKVILEHQKYSEQDLVKSFKRLVKILGDDVNVVFGRKKELEGEFGSGVDFDFDFIDVERWIKKKVRS